MKKTYTERYTYIKTTSDSRSGSPALPGVALKKPHEHLDKKLRWRLRVYVALASVMLAIVIYDVMQDRAHFLPPLIAIFAGIGFGVLMSRMFKISWSGETRQIISRFDAIGLLFLFLYIAFAINREQILSYFVQGPAVAAATLAFIAGMMIGRILGMRSKIIQVLREQNIKF